MSRISATYATTLLEQGELVALPTETVYGLAGRMDREETLKRIFTVKGRPFFDPLIVHVANAAQAKALTKEWPAVYDALTSAFWPGPLTLVAPRGEAVSPLITSGLESVALRCPRHPDIQKILTALNVPLAAPSANRFGHTSPTSAAHVEQEFGDAVPVVDGGDCEIGVESTVLAARPAAKDKWVIEILRPGGVSRREIAQALERAKIPFVIERVQSHVAPGHLKHHYQPDRPLVIVPKAEGVTDEHLLSTLKPMLKVPCAHISRLNLNSDPRQAARELYHRFRTLANPGAAIVVERGPEHTGEEWEAVWDRIERAASLDLTHTATRR